MLAVAQGPDEAIALLVLLNAPEGMPPHITPGTQTLLCAGSRMMPNAPLAHQFIHPPTLHHSTISPSLCYPSHIDRSLHIVSQDYLVTLPTPFLTLPSKVTRMQLYGRRR